ncbi:mono/diheme cytochrome c family protein [Bradyrhizobium sp. R2.2-H]|jgi:mono/diheme cytochrome c family protein|uniref:c-type cytochrome n=1 Tax=unclassified Bradyrhizobium TaxID=2631580 RepID=UPI00104A7061|nr:MULTISPECIES: cytochrome c [unclassified Bradyrhizobium]TCU76597.1 mono/diheme cytochrome c family protein [Bradyrhizobium sp. Y-H1]TCU79670.1 mono/diheme cytochrome c family protein [Bradyrhizobium sp. R2.2-H]
MRTILAVIALCSAVAGAALAAEPSPELIAYGKALVEAGDCAGCHTADPAKPFAGGKRIDTPFGAIYAPNLTPDRDTGIGAWGDADFTRALRYGIAPDGSNYYPAFPYPYFTKMTKDDTVAIRAYLATLAPVASRNKPPELRWPFGYRGLMRLWNAMYFKPGLFEPDQSESAAWNRGGYLVTGLGHCGACHTPKNYFGADRDTQALSGNGVGGWFAPRLDGAVRTGLKSWSEEDIAEYLQSGRNAKSHAGGPMAEVVVNSTAKMSDADVRAIAIYLKSLPSTRRETIVTPPDDAEMKAGQAVYAKLCIACHEADGSGAPRIYPPLPGNALLQSNNPSSTLRIILDGAHTVTTPRAPNTGEMPGYAKQLSDDEIAAVTNYIRNSWGNAGLLVTPAQVARARKREANGE